ncbi:MAG: tripartite tricarboxylate transporter permease [Candidatus Rokubacteria bacterium]|nr:tripartite tricarboxylate transporter permease [Candidatus Rokubacteria bacterium]
MANVMAYDRAKKFSRRPEKFGTGIPEGIIASESANNANVGGSLVTIMAFGIPGDAVTAVMLGAMIIHGIQPGPLFMTQQPKVAYGLFAAYLVAHPVMMVLQWVLARVYLKAVRVPKAILVPNVLVLCVIGAYALNNVMSNVYALLIFGILGYVLVKFRFPLATLILGVILGDQIEVNLVRAIMTDADPWLFLTRPISGAMLALSVLSVVAALWQHRRMYRRAAAATEPDRASRGCCALRRAGGRRRGSARIRRADARSRAAGRRPHARRCAAPSAPGRERPRARRARTHSDRGPTSCRDARRVARATTASRAWTWR